MKIILTSLILLLSLICNSQTAEQLNKQFEKDFNLRIKVLKLNKTHTNYFNSYLEKRLDYYENFSNDKTLQEPELGENFDFPSGCPITWIEFEWMPLTSETLPEKIVSDILNDLTRQDVHLYDPRYTFWGVRFRVDKDGYIKMSLIQSNFTTIWRPNEPKNH